MKKIYNYKDGKAYFDNDVKMPISDKEYDMLFMEDGCLCESGNKVYDYLNNLLAPNKFTDAKLTDILTYIREHNVEFLTKVYEEEDVEMDYLYVDGDLMWLSDGYNEFSKGDEKWEKFLDEVKKIDKDVETIKNKTMERKDVAIIWDNRNDVYCAISAKDIENGLLHDTYNEYGQKLSEYDAGDYTFGEENFDIELECFLRDKFEILGNAVFYFDRNGICDYEVELTDEQVIEINDAITKFADENESFTEATFFNYWDGSNYRTILLDTPGYDAVYEIVDDEVADEIFEDFDNANEIDDINGVRRFEGEKYNHSTSRWQGNPFYFESENK